MRRPLRQIVVPLVSSLGMHIAAAAVLLLEPELPRLSMPLPIELRAIERTRAKAATPTPSPPPAAKPRAPRPPRPKAEAKVKPARGAGPGPAKQPDGPPAAPPPAPTDLRPLGPPEARLVIVLRMDRLRQSPHRQAAENLLAAWPDYRTLLDGTGLSAIDAFEALLIASSDPHDVTATFLAARHADDAKLREALAFRPLPPWDPRLLRFLAPQLTVLVRPEGAERLDLALEAPDGGSRPTPAADAPASDATIATAWLSELRHFERIAEAPGAPALLATLDEADALIRLRDDLPTPRSLALALTAEAALRLTLKLEFSTTDEGARFVEGWPRVLLRWRASMRYFGMGALLDGLALKREEATVTVEGEVSELQTRVGLAWLEALFPRLPSREPADGGAAEEAGTDATR